MAKTPFLGGSSTARSISVAADRAVNIYPEMAENGRDVGAFIGAPGRVLFAALGANIRGVHVVGDYIYALSANTLKRVDTLGNITTLGTIGGPSTGLVSMADNGAEICLVDGYSGYLLTIATSVVSVILSFPAAGAKTVTFQDGYFLAELPGTQKDYQSDLYDGTTWDALNFASKEGGPDNVVAVLSDHRELWKFGEKTTEVWYNSNAGTYAFSRVNGAFLEVGAVNAYVPAKLDNSVFWLANDGVVYRANGYNPQRVSTHAVEYAISQMEQSDAFAWSYKQEGHAFYCLSFLAGGITWCFDASTGKWTERAGWNDGLIVHPATCAVEFNGGIYVGDGDGNICRLDLDAFDDNGAIIKRIRRWAHVADGGREVVHNGLQLIAETGVGISTGQGSDPQVMLRWSDDGGHFWSNEHWTDLGAMGKRKTRAIWRRLGRSRDRVYEVSMTDPVKCVWIGAELDAS